MRRGGVLDFIIASRRVEDYYFIYLFTHQSFLLSNFWLSGRMPPTLQFSVFVGVGKLYSGVRFSGSYYHAVSLLFLLLLPTNRRSFAVYLRGSYWVFQLARISHDDCHSTKVLPIIQ